MFSYIIFYENYPACDINVSQQIYNNY